MLTMLTLVHQTRRDCLAWVGRLRGKIVLKKVQNNVANYDILSAVTTNHIESEVIQLRFTERQQIAYDFKVWKHEKELETGFTFADDVTALLAYLDVNGMLKRKEVNNIE